MKMKYLFVWIIRHLISFVLNIFLLWGRTPVFVLAFQWVTGIELSFFYLEVPDLIFSFVMYLGWTILVLVPVSLLYEKYTVTILPNGRIMRIILFLGTLLAACFVYLYLIKLIFGGEFESLIYSVLDLLLTGILYWIFYSATKKLIFPNVN